MEARRAQIKTSIIFLDFMRCLEIGVVPPAFAPQQGRTGAIQAARCCVSSWAWRVQHHSLHRGLPGVLFPKCRHVCTCCLTIQKKTKELQQQQQLASTLLQTVPNSPQATSSFGDSLVPVDVGSLNARDGLGSSLPPTCGRILNMHSGPDCVQMCNDFLEHGDVQRVIVTVAALNFISKLLHAKWVQRHNSQHVTVAHLPVQCKVPGSPPESGCKNPLGNVKPPGSR